MSAAIVSAAELIARLESKLSATAGCALAFDADGTLWSGDVGDDLFRFAIAQRRLREEARAEIERQASTRGFAICSDVHDTAKSLFDMYVAGRYPEREICELMTWCYAGHSLAEMQELAREALHASRLAERLHEELRPIFDLARTRGLRAVVISASPRAMVEQAARLWGFSPADIAASTPEVRAGVITPAMAGPVPYASDKVKAGRELLGGARWVASFGDNVFDLEMMREAEIAVAVRPKPALEARLLEIEGVLRLAP